jgi:RNA polymerase sigma-70 factor (sigma-E family)
MDLLRRDRTRAEFDRFVMRHSDGLLKTGYLMTADLLETEDLVQECLLRVARRWPRVRSMEHPEAYARRILVNLALRGSRNRTRRNKELQTSEDRFDRGLLGERAVLDRPLGDPGGEVLAALSSLPGRQRAVLVLRYFGDHSEADVAETLGCSPGTVKSTASRALARLREALEQPPDDGEIQTDRSPTREGVENQ